MHFTNVKGVSFCKATEGGFSQDECVEKECRWLELQIAEMGSAMANQDKPVRAKCPLHVQCNHMNLPCRRKGPSMSLPSRRVRGGAAIGGASGCLREIAVAVLFHAASIDAPWTKRSEIRDGNPDFAPLHPGPTTVIRPFLLAKLPTCCQHRLELCTSIVR